MALISILSIAYIVFFALYLYENNKNRNLKKEIINLENSHSEVNERFNQLKGRYERLEEKYKPVTDAEEEAKKIIRLANQEKESKDLEIIKLNQFIKEAQKNLRENERNSLQKVNLMLNDATLQANQIIKTATDKAELIGGEAYKALKDIDILKATIIALQNTINGYGDDYLIPSFSLLDELAADFGYTQAGEELKKARERTRLMVKNKVSANCDYKDNLLRSSAIDFVTDAFNGKVDTILMNLKHDNYGVVSQKIKDAYFLVNNLGRGFKNATITVEFLESRMTELKWAVIALELRTKEKEEQRQIKERIKEEEKAKRDYEKALKEAEKEEEMLRRAIEKARQEVAQANEIQKAKYDERLKELELKLKVAEEKGQRAISMAQQTRSGHVYIISNIGSFGEDVFKIGMTRRLEPLDRVKELGDASVPFEFDVHAMIYSDDAPALEKDLHKKFLELQVNKVNPRKEFFRVDLKEIRKTIEAIGVETKWTMTAQAKEYRESLSIEKSLKNNSVMKEQWEKQQLTVEHSIDD